MRSLKPLRAIAACAAAVPIVVLAASAANAAGPNTSFAFNARDITGSSGAVTLTGGGAFNPTTHPAHAGGSFSCTSAVTSGPLGVDGGCQTGQGVRWDSDSLQVSTPFRCLPPDKENAKTVFTSDDTVVLHADFYRAGDGTNESFQANMIVSADDIDGALPGTQNVWVQGVGCATGAVHFSR
jgi:opacity protein-like surface antigen